MKKIFKKFVAVTLTLAVGAACAQAYPSKSITIVVPFSAGGAVDVATRLLMNHIAAHSGAAIVVENRPGGEGSIAAQAVKRKEADGYTLLAVAPFLVTAPMLRNSPGFATSDFVPVAQMGDGPYVMVATNSLPAKTFKELVKYGLDNPGKLNAAIISEGGTMHMGAETFAVATGVRLQMVPFKGAPDAVPGLVSGDIHFSFVPVSVAAPLLKAGKIRAIAVASPKRLPALPDVPTFHEAGGSPDIVANSWYGVVARKGTPAPVVAWWNAQLNQALNAPKVSQEFQSLGIVPTPGTPQQFGQLLTEEYSRWSREFQRLNIQPK